MSKYGIHCSPYESDSRDSPNDFRIGFLINPIAGMGGRVGLKGTDGEALQKAMELGAEIVADDRARSFLRRLESEIKDFRGKFTVVTCRGAMGSNIVSEYNLHEELISYQPPEKTTAEDTMIACQMLATYHISLLVFVGGDGTARDVYNAFQSLPSELPGIIGVPSGVKMYSGIFAVTPEAAAEIVKFYILGEADTADFEIMDADEEQFRSDHFAIQLYGYLSGPYVPLKIQGAKQLSPSSDSEHENQLGVAQFASEIVGRNPVLLGPGTTTKEIASVLGREKTLLGVDHYIGDDTFLDVNELDILNNPRFDSANTWVVVSPIGHQGIIFGRGNQQISPSIIRAILERGSKERIVIAATKSKLEGLEDGKLRVDTGDSEVDDLLRGYLKVITDYMEWKMVQVI
ncbi:MAG: ATP-NAD kinase family protein [Candidatus Thorarchaeota archaeon]